jgi:hypothetical protein
MRRTTALFIAPLLLLGAAATPAAARPERAPEVRRLDARSQARLADARADREEAIRKLDRSLAYERRRAQAKYAGRPHELKAAYRRLEQWYDNHRAAIDRRFRDRRDAIAAESRPAGPARTLALLKARRERDLRSIDADLASEIQRARRKYAGRPHEMKAAFRRLDDWAERRRAAVREEFRREAAKVRVRRVRR